MARPHLELILARSLVAHVAVPAFLADADGRIVYFNEAAETLTGRSFEDSPELTAQDLFVLLDARTLDGESVKPDLMPIPRAIGFRLPATLEATAGGDASRRFSAIALPLLDREGLVIGALSLWYGDRG